MLTLLFMLLLLVILLSYGYYPWWVKNVSEQQPISNKIDNNFYPEVTLIFSCFNEEKVIVEKIKNIQNLDYPKDKLYVLIGSDGSKDQTPTLLLQNSNDQISIYLFPEQRGKIHVISDLVKDSKTDILIFCDANSMFEPNAIKNLVKHFADTRIGGVCGKLILNQSMKKLNYESRYWNMESRIKYWEGKSGFCIGANGAIFSMRKEYFPNYNPKIMFTDDLVFGLNVLLEGKLFIYEQDAIAHETESSTLIIEFKRKMRIGRSNLSSFKLVSGWKDKLSSNAKKAFIYHKILRWTIPILIFIVFIASLIDLYYLSMISIVVVFIHLYVLFGFIFETLFNISLPAKPIIYGLSMNYGLLGGYVLWLLGKNKPFWESTVRT